MSDLSELTELLDSVVCAKKSCVMSDGEARAVSDRIRVCLREVLLPFAPADEQSRPDGVVMYSSDDEGLEKAVQEAVTLRDALREGLKLTDCLYVDEANHVEDWRRRVTKLVGE